MVVYFDNFSTVGGSAHNTYEDKQILLVPASKDIGLEVNANNSKYMVISRDNIQQNDQFKY